MCGGMGVGGGDPNLNLPVVEPEGRGIWKLLLQLGSDTCPLHLTTIVTWPYPRARNCNYMSCPEGANWKQLVNSS